MYALGLMMYSLLNGGFLPLCYPGMTPEAEKVAVVCREDLPVCACPVQDTVSSPLPCVLLGETHDAYAIS